MQSSDAQTKNTFLRLLLNFVLAKNYLCPQRILSAFDP